MTPKERLKSIKELNKDDWFCDNPNGADIREEIYWLIARVEQLEEAIKPILFINECHCDVAYRTRHMHAPNSLCGELDELVEALTTGPKPDGE